MVKKKKFLIFYSYDKLIELYPNKIKNYKLKSDLLIQLKRYDDAIFLLSHLKNKVCKLNLISLSFEK